MLASKLTVASTCQEAPEAPELVQKKYSSQMPKSVNAPEGVQTDTWKLAPEEKKQATKRIDMEAAAAEKKWAEAAKKGDWTLPRTPLSCYRFGPKVEKDPRLEPEYVSGVLEDLEIVGKDALPHLSPADRKAVVDQLTRRAAA